MAPRPIFGPWLLRCRGFKTFEFLQVEDVSPTPKPQPDEPRYLSPCVRHLPQNVYGVVEEYHMGGEIGPSQHLCMRCTEMHGYMRRVQKETELFK